MIRNWAVWAIAALTGGALLLAGCGSETATAAETATPATACFPPSPIADAELAVFADGLRLPEGVSVVTARISTDGDYPGRTGVAFDLCVPGSADADALRPIASDIARALEPTPLGQRTFVLYVSDTGPEFNTEAELVDPNYLVNLWNGEPSQAAENERWKVLGG